MEFANGGDIFDILRKCSGCRVVWGRVWGCAGAGVLTEDWSRHLFRQLVEGASSLVSAQLDGLRGAAIRYCHSKNVVHGDVSPENCLVTNNATIKLAGMCVLCAWFA